MKKILSIALIFAVMSATFFVFAKISAQKNNFKQAEDFPRDALIYVQIQDLPVFIKLWNESEIRRKYLESANFAEFENNHLALKLAQRANEINEAVGIFPDLGFASVLSENRAALAVYDIGKIEFVFIAPMSGEEKILASVLFQKQADFEEIRLDAETIVYSKEIEIDRARQRQKILFSNFRGRLILATSEKYILQTLDNIKGKTPKNRLTNEPLFKQIAEKTKPNLATVWLNQQKLNGDWYFKNYWLMTKTKNLANLRAGMFDFEIQAEKVIERRVFLTADNKFLRKIKMETANRLTKLIPANVHFYNFETFENDDFDAAVSDVLFDVKRDSQTIKTSQTKKDYYFRDWGKSYGYSYLDDDFSEQIDEIEAGISTGTIAKNTGTDFTKIIGAANPTVSLKLFSPQNLPPPLFFETRKALIFSLQNPANLNRQVLETAISKTAQNLFTVNYRNSEFVWTDFSAENFQARQLALPSLGWKMFYILRQNELLFANSEELLKEILATRENYPKFAETFEKFTVVNLKNGRGVFNEVFQTLENDDKNSSEAGSNNFFTGNVGSLLNVVSDVERIEIRQTSAPNFLFEEIGFVLKKKPE